MRHVSRRFRNLSLGHKIAFAGIATSALSLVIACAVLVFYDLSSARGRLVREIDLLADADASAHRRRVSDIAAAKADLDAGAPGLSGLAFRRADRKVKRGDFAYKAESMSRQSA